MRSTNKDRNILWGWISKDGIAKGGNCDFVVVKPQTGAYEVHIPDGLPWPCGIVATPLATGTSVFCAFVHLTLPTEYYFKIGILTGVGTYVDEDFYWAAIGS